MSYVLAGESDGSQGGCGKTYVVAKALIAAGVDFVIACPSNELAIEHIDLAYTTCTRML